MHPLYRYTLDLFERNRVEVPVASAQDAIKSISIKTATPAVALTDVLAPANFRHPRANREMRLRDAHVAYEFKRGKRRTIGFSVGPEGLVVRAPKWTPLCEVEAALREKAVWVVKKLDETRQRHAQLESHRIDWRDGAALPFLGQSLTVILGGGQGLSAGGAVLEASSVSPVLHLPLPRSATPTQIRDAVQAWLMRQAKALFIERLDHFAAQLQVQWRKLSLSNAGTRWGSARVDGSIRLNWRLIHLNLPVIDYVVAHELSHLRVMNHSPHFWETVGSVVPDHKQLRGQLKEAPVPRWD